MGQLIVRNIPDAVKDRLKKRAKRHGRSMEEEVREILRTAAHERDDSGEGLGTRIANRFRGIGIDFEIPQLRGYTVRAPEFDE